MEMPSTWSGYRSCPHSLPLDSKGQFWVSASLGKMGRLGGGVGHCHGASYMSDSVCHSLKILESCYF